MTKIAVHLPTVIMDLALMMVLEYSPTFVMSLECRLCLTSQIQRGLPQPVMSVTLFKFQLTYVDKHLSLRQQPKLVGPSI